ncbi:MAG: outer membrane porin, OprD family [Epsilonproteobacteria bacterium]|nr:outer membrane porin, OprD family [Campylobacterota bacterium]
MTKLSLVAILAVSAAFAGGDIAPVEPVIEAPVVEAAACNANTTISGKAVAYYYTDDSVDFFDNKSSSLGLAATLDVTHNFTENISANFSAVGFTNAISDNYMDAQKSGAYFNVANITATFADTTAVLGRQLINSPMFGGYDWLLAPAAFEAYTLVNNSISNVTLVGTYVTKMRGNNSGSDFAKLSDDNYALGAVYGADALSASVWYYNIDDADYTQVYVDAGYNFGMFNVAAQYVATDYDLGQDSDAYGIKVGATLAGFDLTAAYNDASDRAAAFVSNNGLYTAQWNSAASLDDIGSSWKVAAATEFAGVSAEVSYADYDVAGEEFDVILGYGVTKCISLDAIYANTKYTETEDATQQLEFVATYKF